MDVESRYLQNDYLESNPTWDAEDSPWKAAQVVSLLQRNGLNPVKVAEVGCGAGGVIAALRAHLGEGAQLEGYDISPGAESFWLQHAAKRVRFAVGDFLKIGAHDYDLILLMDVIEHLENPFEFLRQIRNKCEWLTLHIPLDISAQAVIRKGPLIKVRSKVGHIHYYNKDMALMLLEECGYQVMDWYYTPSGLALAKSWSAHLMAIPRKLLFRMTPDFAVRALGGLYPDGIGETEK